MSETQPIEPADDATLDRLDELMSAFFDDALVENEVAELNELLLNDPVARARCFDTAQLHADLLTLFREEPADGGKAIAPSLTGLSGVDLSGIPAS